MELAAVIDRPTNCTAFSMLIFQGHPIVPFDRISVRKAFTASEKF